MTNRLALILAATILAAAAADAVLNDARTLVFLGRKFFALIEWLAFWR